MMGYRPDYRGRLSSHGAAPDTEALQTDVMRFMAILGLCLTAIFALLRSLPQPATVTPAAVQEDAAQQDDTGLLDMRRQIARAADELQAMQAQRQHLQQALDSAARDLVALRDAQRREEAKQQQARREELEARTLAPPTRQDPPTTTAKAAPAASLPQRRTETPPEAPRSAGESAINPETQTPKALPMNEATGPAQGFVLRFASSAALDHLVAEGRVVLLAMTPRDSWQLTLQDGRIRASAAPRRGEYHEMARQTVPAAYWQHLQTHAGLTEPGQVTWGVRLPAATRAAIRRLVDANSGGTLVIGPDGGVRLQAGGTG